MEDIKVAMVGVETLEMVLGNASDNVGVCFG
jgi:hypothetical protein